MVITLFNNRVLLLQYYKSMMIKQKFNYSLIFALFAFSVVLLIIIVIGLISGEPSTGFKFIMRHEEMYVPYMIVPAIVAFVSAFGLVKHIKFDPRKKNNNNKSWIITSILIVILSLFLWGFIMVFIFQNNEKWMGCVLAFYAGTIYSPALYPLGLSAGFIVWRLNKKSFLRSHDG